MVTESTLGGLVTNCSAAADGGGPLRFHGLLGTVSVKPCTDNNCCSSDVLIVAGLLLLNEFSIFGTRLGLDAVGAGAGVLLIICGGNFSRKFCKSVDFTVTVWTVAMLGVMAMEVTDSLRFHGPREGTENS